jgi:hypothetical protein
MDTDKLVAHSRARFDHAAAKRTLKEKYQAQLIFGWNGGMFETTPEMITFFALCGDKLVVVLDMYENPIEVKASDLLHIMHNRWEACMKNWHAEYQELNKKR